MRSMEDKEEELRNRWITLSLIIFMFVIIGAFIYMIYTGLTSEQPNLSVEIKYNHQIYDVSENVGDALYLIANTNISQSEMLKEIEIKMDELTDSNVNIYTGKIMDSKAQNYGMIFVITEKSKTYSPYGFNVTGYFESPYLTEYESIIVTFSNDEIVVIKGVKTN